jgi:hypothetical protein
MSFVPEGYPFDSSDDEIRETLRALAEPLSGGDVNDVLRNAPLVNLGLAELERREQRRVNRLVLAVALLAAWVAAVSFTVGYFGDRGWQRNEIRELHRIELRLSTPTSSPSGTSR